MFRALMGIIAAGATLGHAAFAGNINGTLQEEFSCPAANCTTSCVGPGGAATITGYKDLSAWMIGQPDRLWLQKTDSQNNVSEIVLGVGDRCTFGGTPLTISSPLQISPLPPVKPGCTCIGNQCTPPGCNQN